MHKNDLRTLIFISLGVAGLVLPDLLGIKLSDFGFAIYLFLYYSVLRGLIDLT